jgi:hypothetical protein
MHDEVEVLVEVQADIRHHAGEKDVSTGIQRRHGDGLAPQVADGADCVRPEQFEAANVEPRQDDDRVSRLQAEEQRRREVPIEVGFARGQRRLNIGGPRFLEVVYLGEAFAAQQFFGHILRGLTDARDLHQPDARRFGRWLRRHPPGVQAEQPSGPRKRHPAEKSPSAELSSVLNTHRHLPSRDVG